MSVSNGSTTPIRLPFWLWARAIFDLRRRGRGKGESGAFLLGPNNSGTKRVSEYICYDELDPDAYQNGAIAFHAFGYAALWQYCKERKLEVLADVHTHPGAWVGQSSVDQRHPMVPVVGHTAIVVPHFANTGWWSLDPVGVYEYLGSFKWRIHPASDRSRRVKLSLW